MRKANITAAFIAVLVLVGFSTIAIKSGSSIHSLDIKTPKLETTADKLQGIDVQYQKLNVQLNNKSTTDKKTINNLKSQQQKLQQEKQDLQKQLQAKVDEKAKLQVAATNAVDTVTATSSASADSFTDVIVPNCGDNSYANYIYTHESGCSTAVTNSEGCIGIGQACPASKLTSACPNLDYDCENAFFTSYAVARYGGWEGAYNFWVNNHWW